MKTCAIYQREVSSTHKRVSAQLLSMNFCSMNTPFTKLRISTRRLVYTATNLIETSVKAQRPTECSTRDRHCELEAKGPQDKVPLCGPLPPHNAFTRRLLEDPRNHDRGFLNVFGFLAKLFAILSDFAGGGLGFFCLANAVGQTTRHQIA